MIYPDEITELLRGIKQRLTPEDRPQLDAPTFDLLKAGLKDIFLRYDDEELREKISWVTYEIEHFNESPPKSVPKTAPQTATHSQKRYRGQVIEDDAPPVLTKKQDPIDKPNKKVKMYRGQIVKD